MLLSAGPGVGLKDETIKRHYNKVTAAVSKIFGIEKRVNEHSDG